MNQNNGLLEKAFIWKSWASSFKKSGAYKYATPQWLKTSKIAQEANANQAIRNIRDLMPNGARRCKLVLSRNGDDVESGAWIAFRAEHSNNNVVFGKTVVDSWETSPERCITNVRIYHLGAHKDAVLGMPQLLAKQDRDTISIDIAVSCKMEILQAGLIEH